MVYQPAPLYSSPKICLFELQISWPGSLRDAVINRRALNPVICTSALHRDLPICLASMLSTVVYQSASLQTNPECRSLPDYISTGKGSSACSASLRRTVVCVTLSAGSP